MAYHIPNMFRPNVQPDTLGIGAGLAGFGDAIAGGIEGAIDNRREDRHRAEDRQHAIEDRNALFDRQDLLYARGRREELADRSALFDRQDELHARDRNDKLNDKERDRQLELQAAAGMVAALANAKHIDQSLLDLFDRTPDGGKVGVAEAIARIGGLNASEQAKLRQQQERNRAALQTRAIIDPVTGKPHEGHFVTGNGQIIPRQQPGQRQRQLTAEELQRLQQDTGLKIKSARINSDGETTFTLETPEDIDLTGGLIFNNDDE